jgi:uncharacterized membrane protein
MAESVQASLARAVEAAAQGVEGVAALLLVWAAAFALATLAHLAATRRLSPDGQRRVWLGLARWLVLSLEFQLAADLLRTTISRTWTDIGHVAALALIRTFLNYALEADLEKAAARDRAQAASPAQARPDPARSAAGR